MSKNNNKKQAEKLTLNEQAQKKLSPIMTFVFLGIFTVGSAFLVQYILQTNIKKYSNEPDFVDLQDRLQTFSNNLVVLGGYVLVFAMLALASRILAGKAFPVENDAQWVYIFNRIIQNTLEQSLIFVPGYLHLTLTGNKGISQSLFCLFITGRYLFSIGYFLSQYIMIPSLRGPGFILTIGSSVLIYSQMFGYNLIDKIIQ